MTKRSSSDDIKASRLDSLGRRRGFGKADRAIHLAFEIRAPREKGGPSASASSPSVSAAPSPSSPARGWKRLTQSPYPRQARPPPLAPRSASPSSTWRNSPAGGDESRAEQSNGASYSEVPITSTTGRSEGPLPARRYAGDPVKVCWSPAYAGRCWSPPTGARPEVIG